MEARRKPPAEAWRGNLLAVWTILTAFALCLATVFFLRDGDVRIFLVALAGPFCLGLILFGTLALADAGSRTAQPPVEVAPRGKRRDGIFGKR